MGPGPSQPPKGALPPRSAELRQLPSSCKQSPPLHSTTLATSAPGPAYFEYLIPRRRPLPTFKASAAAAVRGERLYRFPLDAYLLCVS